MGVTRSRGPTIVTLWRTSTQPKEGIYKCWIQDNSDTSNGLYVGLYRSGSGNGKGKYFEIVIIYYGKGVDNENVMYKNRQC